MSNKPHLVLLPGLDGTGELFAPIAPLLREACDVSIIRYTNQTTFEEAVEHASSQLPTDTELSLVAESFSGPVAIALLANRNFCFRPSVLCATFTKGPYKFLTEIMKQLPVKSFGLDAVNRITLDLFGIDKSTSPEVRVNVLSALESIGPVEIKNRIKILNEVNVSSLVSDIETPVLYIRATRDRILSEALQQELIKLFKNIQVSEVEGPHLLLQSKPKECAKLIIEHVTSNKALQSDRQAATRLVDR